MASSSGRMVSFLRPNGVQFRPIASEGDCVQIRLVASSSGRMPPLQDENDQFRSCVPSWERRRDGVWKRNRRSLFLVAVGTDYPLGILSTAANGISPYGRGQQVQIGCQFFKSKLSQFRDPRCFLRQAHEAKQKLGSEIEVDVGLNWLHAV